MAQDIHGILSVITEAQQKAFAVNNINDDGGTCNFDQPVIDLSGWKRSEVTALISQANGMMGEKISGKHWKGCYFMDFTLDGQAKNRTRMAEAAYNYMKEAGLPVRMYYQAD